MDDQEREVMTTISPPPANRIRNKIKRPSITFQIVQLKLFHNKLLVLDSICLRGSTNLISSGDRCLVHVSGSDVRKQCEDILRLGINSLINNEHVSSDDDSSSDDTTTKRSIARWWVPMTEPRQSFGVRFINNSSSQNRPTAMERNRRGDRLINCNCDDILLLGVFKPMGDGADDDDAFDADDDDANHIDDDVVHDDDEHDDVGVSIGEKKLRHEIFASWLVETYGIEYLSVGSGVLDVAGGNGELTRALKHLGVPSVVLDPNPRIITSRHTRNDELLLTKQQVNQRTNNDDGDVDVDGQQSLRVLPYALYSDGSGLTNRSDEVGETVRSCSFIAGCHPDQATEAIVDTALRLGVHFAVVPCCVMPSLFPHRRQRKGSGDPVRSYNAFCQYLLDKGSHLTSDYCDDVCGGDGDMKRRFEMISLPFVGRNKVIFSLPPSGSSSNE